MQKEDDPYETTADVYDLMTQDAMVQKFYGDWREILLKTIAERRVPVRTLVGI